MKRKSLSDIVNASGAARLRQSWQQIEAAGDLEPVPKGVYIAHVVAGELLTSKKNATPGYQLTFKICEGDFAGRQLWHTCWLSEAALPMAKRDLAKLGVTDPDQLEQPLPQGIRCELHVVTHEDDDGVKRNAIKRFAAIGIDEPSANPFPPKVEAAPTAPAAPPSGVESAMTLKAGGPEPAGTNATAFPFGCNIPPGPESPKCSG